MLMSARPFPKWAEWSVLRWSQGASVKEIYSELIQADLPIHDWRQVSVIIEDFLIAGWPQYTSLDTHDILHLTVTQDDSRELARRYFELYPECKSPDEILGEKIQRESEKGKKKALAKTRLELAKRRELINRVRDPDEATAPRSVWMTYLPGPSFDFMEPVK